MDNLCITCIYLVNYLWITCVLIMETVTDAGTNLWTSRGANIVETWVGLMNLLQTDKGLGVRWK